MKKKIPSISITRRKTKKSDVYGVSYRYGGKHYRYVVGPSKKDAELEKARLTVQFNDGRFGLDSIIPISLENLITNYAESKSQHLAKSTISRNKNYASPFQKYINRYFSLAARDVSHLKTNYIEKFFNEVLVANDFTEKIWSKKTANNCREYLSGLFTHAVKIKACKENPVTGTKPFKLIEPSHAQFYSQEELTIIFKKMNPHWVPFFKFLLYTGLRNAEIRNLKWSNVSLDSSNPYIAIAADDQFTPKNRCERIVHLSKPAIEILERQKGQNKTYVFCTPVSRRMIPKDDPLHIIKRTLKGTGIEGNVHKFRHTFASFLVMQGVPLNTLAELLGQKDIGSTKIYAHLSAAYKQDSVNMLNNLIIE